MELAFETKNLRSICESEAYALSQLGVVPADTLKRRLADMMAAQTVNDLMQLLIIPLYEDRSEASNLVVDLNCGKRMIFTHNHLRPPLLEKEKVDWSKVSRIKIIAINNHE